MEQKRSTFLRLVGVIVGLTLLISLIVIIVGMVYHWNKPVQFSNGFFAAGAIVIVIGTFSVTGGLEQRANFPILYAESAGQASISERTQRMMADINQRYGMMTLLMGVGALLIGISIAVNKLL